MPDEPAPFWRAKSMAEMTRAEWESLCDGCGRCCLNKLIDEDTNQTVFTDVGCKLLDGQTCRCTDYPRRQSRVKDCVRLTPRPSLTPTLTLPHPNSGLPEFGILGGRSRIHPTSAGREGASDSR